MKNFTPNWVVFLPNDPHYVTVCKITLTYPYNFPKSHIDWQWSVSLNSEQYFYKKICITPYWAVLLYYEQHLSILNSITPYWVIWAVLRNVFFYYSTLWHLVHNEQFHFSVSSITLQWLVLSYNKKKSYIVISIAQ